MNVVESHAIAATPTFGCVVPVSVAEYARACIPLWPCVPNNPCPDEAPSTVLSTIVADVGTVEPVPVSVSKAPNGCPVAPAGTVIVFCVPMGLDVADSVAVNVKARSLDDESVSPVTVRPTEPALEFKTDHVS